MKEYTFWSEEDLEDLDDKFDALAEYLGVEFVFERVSDGGDAADRSRCYARAKLKDTVLSILAPTKQENIAASVSPENIPDLVPDIPPEIQVVKPPPNPYEKKHKKKYSSY